MKITKNKLIALAFGLIFILSLIAFAIITQVSNIAFADTATVKTENASNKTNYDEFVVLDSQNIVPATYTFSKLNERECSVRIANKTTATTAVIPTFGEINGVKYRVVEIAANGFMSSTNLVRVSLPVALRKIGNMAFYNCPKLERINLSNVEAIGNNVFYKCLKLEEIIIPASVKSMGTSVFKNNNTTVKLRADNEAEGWTSSWNANNNNQNVVYGCKDVQPLELETVYSASARSATPTVSYTLAGGQPRTDNFYLNPENFDDYVERDSNNIFVPSSFNGVEINAISGEAFAGVGFDQLIIEYGAVPIKIGNNVFLSANSEDESVEINSTIVINREIVFTDVFEGYGENNESSNIFLEAKVKAIVLPDNITRIPESAFNCCFYLENIYFRTPEVITDREEMLGIINKAEADNIKAINQDESIDLTQIGHSSVVYLPKNITFIGSDAFSSANKIRVLNIYENVTEVESRIVSEWDNDTQIVKVHNTKKIEYGEGKWAEDWNAEFTNYYFDKEFYRINFDPNGGTFTEIPEDYEKIFNSDNTTILSVAIVVPDNIEFDELPTVFYDNNVFTGWEDSKGNKYNIGENYTFDSDTILYAKWERIYTISFNANGGTVSPEEIQVVHNNKIGKMPTPKNGNFQFNGWYYNETQYTEETIYYNDFSISLTARWIERYEITFDPNGGTVSPTSKIVVLDDVIGNLPEPTNGLHIFEGWYMGNTEYTSSTEYTIKDDIILTAKWTYRYTIHIDPNGGSLDYDSFVVVFGQPINNIPESEKPGNKFLGWFDKNHKEYKNGDIFELNEDLYLKADWKKIIYITLDDQDGKNTTHIVEAFNNEKLPLVDINGEELGIPPKTGYVFLGYYTQKEGGTPLYINESDKLISEDCPFESDTTLYGQYDYFRYEINYIYDSRGIENSNRKDFTINDVINNTFTFKPIVDYNHSPAQKVLWSIKNIGEAAKTNYLEDKCIEVVGSWSNIELHISYNLNGGTNNSVNPSVLYYGDHIVLSSPSRVGYEFLEWRDDKGFYVSDEIFYVYITDLKYDNMSLTAQWRNRINAVKTTSNYTDKEITVTRDTIIELPKRNFSSTCVINVSSAANKLHIYSPNGSTYNLRLIIEPRLTEGFELILEHLTMTLPVSYSTEKNEEYCILSYTKLNLYTYGFVAIKGRNGANGNIYGNKNGGDGMAAIRCSMLEVHRADNLLITGGNGGIAASGTRITDNGGKAGSGAVAIILVFTNNPPILCENVEVYGGCSGDNKTCMNGWYNIPPTVTPPHLKN